MVSFISNHNLVRSAIVRSSQQCGIYLIQDVAMTQPDVVVSYIS